MPIAIQQVLDTLSPAELTIRAQTVSPLDNGQLHWETFFPRQNVNSTRIAEIATVDFRPAASRRPWDAVGRQIPLRIGKQRNGDMEPIEAWFALGEKEIQRYGEGAMGNAAVVLQAMKADIPSRVDFVAQADWRRLELDVFQAWAYGYLTVTDPEDDTIGYNVDFQIDAARYAAAPATYAAAANAYTQFITNFYRPALDAMGSLEGVLLRRSLIDEIVKDAPVAVGIPGYIPTVADVENRITQEYGYPFKFMMAEWAMDTPTDNTLKTFTRTKYWPADRIAGIPAGMTVGKTAIAKQYHAWDLATATALQKVGYDENGITIIPSMVNDGKGAKFLAKLLGMPFPDEGLIFVQTGCA